MSTLIERSREAEARQDEARARYEAERRESIRADAMERTTRVLRAEWGISLDAMTPQPGHDWAGVVEVEGMLFYSPSDRYDAYVRRIVVCPDCGELTLSGELGLADLARNVEQERSGERWANGSPVWITQAHNECPGRPRPPARPEEPAPPSRAEQLVALIRQIAAEEVESQLPA